MRPPRGTYMSSLRGHLRTGAATRSSVLRELSDHIEDRTNELVGQGLTREEAYAEASQRFGNPRDIGSELTLVHNQGSWIAAGLAAAPHVLAAMLFASHRWLEVQLLAPAFLLVMAVGIVGWWKRAPTWVYPWLGYLLFPALLAGAISTVTLGHAIWSIVVRGYTPTDPWIWALGGSIGFAGIILTAYSLVWVSKHDWVQATMLVLPMPVLAVALLAYERGTFATLNEADAQAATLMAFVAVVSVIVMRMADRILKISLIAAALPIGFLLTTRALEPETRLFLVFLLSLPALSLAITSAFASAASAVATRRTGR